LPAADEPGRDPAAEALRTPLLSEKGVRPLFRTENGVRALFRTSEGVRAIVRKRGRREARAAAPRWRRNVPAGWRPKRWSRLAMRTITLTSTRTMPQPSPTSAAADAAGTADAAA